MGNKQSIYLCGAIDHCPNGGAPWRDSISSPLKNLGYIVRDPLKKACLTGLEDDDNRMTRRRLKETGQYDQFVEIMTVVRNTDLAMLYSSDIVIVYIDLNIFACGTIEEIIKGVEAGKPVLVVCEQGKINIPDWLWAIIPTNHMFENFEEVFSFLTGGAI